MDGRQMITESFWEGYQEAMRLMRMGLATGVPVETIMQFMESAMLDTRAELKQ